MTPIAALLWKNLLLLSRSKADAIVVILFALALSIIAALITHGNGFQVNAATSATSVDFSQFLRSRGPMEFVRPTGSPSVMDQSGTTVSAAAMPSLENNNTGNAAAGSSSGGMQQLSSTTSTSNQLFLYVSLSQSSNSAVQLPGIYQIITNTIVALNNSFYLGSFADGATNPQYFTTGELLAAQLATDIANNKQDCNENTVLCIGVEFQSGSPYFSYYLRPNGDNIPNTDKFLVNGDFQSCTDATKCPDAYANNGVVQIQAAIDQGIAMYIANSSAPTFGAVSFNRLGFSQSVSMTTMFTVMAFVVPIVFAFLPLYRYIVAQLVEEKQNGMKRVLILSGVTMGEMFGSWFLVFFFVLLIIVVLVVIIILFVTLSTALVSSSALRGYFFGLTFFYAMNIWSISYIISALCKNTATASTAAIYTALIMSLLYLMIPFTRPYGQAFTYGLPFWLVVILMAFPPFTFSLGLDLIYFTEVVQFGSLERVNASVSLQGALATLIVEFVVYLAVGLILERYLSEEYGSSGNDDKKLECLCTGQRKYPSDDFEATDPNAEPVIRITDLWKVFKVGKQVTRAVRGVNLDVLDGQITCILGHNGAGKSTLINMMTGLLKPTQGSATIFGENLRTVGGASRVHGDIGICTQHASAYRNLTVHEHLKILASVRIIDSPERAISSIIEEVGLAESVKVRSHNLSGGQRRRLNLAMALLGDPKALFLDEPTTGIDPVSRRAIWKILDSRRSRHAIVLTTHYMDEADFLADRKAIMSYGTIRCAGSSLFLKHKFGFGYHLNFELKEMPPQAAMMSRNVIASIVQGNLGQGGYRIAVDTSRRLSFTLPFQAVQVFPRLLDNIDNFRANPQSCNLNDSGISHYSIDPTTLEEVFLRLAREISDAEEAQAEKSNLQSLGHENAHEGREEDDVADDGRDMKALNYWLARSEKPTTNDKWRTMFNLRMLMMRNGWLTTLAGVLLAPVVAAVLAGLYLGFANNYTDVGYNGPPIKFSLNTYAAPAAGGVADDGEPYGVMFEDASTGPGGQANSFDIFSSLMTAGTPNVKVMQGNLQDMNVNASIGISWSNTSSTTKLYYRENALHSPLSAVNIHSNFMLRRLYGVGSYNITVGIAPVGTNLNPVAAALMSTSNTYVFQVPLNQFLAIIPISFVIIFAASASLLQNEQHCGAFDQLRCTGVTAGVYWTVQFVTDSFQYLASFLLTIPALAIVFAIGQAQVEYDSSQIGIAVMLIILYMGVAFLLLYLLVLGMRNKSKALLSFVITAVFFPLPAVATGLLQLELLSSSPALFLPPYYIFLLFPNLLLFAGLSALSYPGAIDPGVTLSFSDYFSGSNAVVYAFIAGLLHLIWEIVALHYAHKSVTERHLPRACARSGDRATPSDVYQMTRTRRDSDVVREEELIQQVLGNGNASNLARAALVCDHVSLTYSQRSCRNAKETRAVKNLTMQARENEILGLVGPNGAGKSSAIKIMIGSERATTGDVYVGGQRIATLSLEDLFDQVSLCTQDDPLWPSITARQHIEHYAKLRGLKAEASQLASKMLKMLHIDAHADKQARHLSGGTKRKVVFAIAMLKTSRVKVILCDEPTSGLDPQSKRVVWSMLQSMFRSEETKTQCACLFTSHSMEEVEAVCDRLDLIISGELQCSGSVQHCKEKYGGCFILDVKTKTVDGMQMLLQFLLQRFGNARVLEADVGRHQRISFPRRDVRSLGGVFRLMEGVMRNPTFALEEYSFGQCALEQVYLDLVRKHVADQSAAVTFGFSNV